MSSASSCQTVMSIKTPLCFYGVAEEFIMRSTTYLATYSLMSWARRLCSGENNKILRVDELEKEFKAGQGFCRHQMIPENFKMAITITIKPTR